jgi:MFS family permease/predicted O-methyltransferase YrrM
VTFHNLSSDQSSEIKATRTSSEPSCGAPVLRQTPEVSDDFALQKRPDRFLLLLVFLAGIGTLGIEMLMPRLLAPFFGTSQPVWAVVIGMTLLYLALGYWLGGRLADRWPDRRVLSRLVLLAGVLCGFIPLLARPVLHASQQAFIGLSAGSFIAALVGVLLLFAAPVVLLAMVGPFAIRLHLHQRGTGVVAAGRSAGAISALSTLGSLVGTFLPVFVLVPWLGTTRTLYLFAAFLLLLGLASLRRWRYVPLLLLLALLAAYDLTGERVVRGANCPDCVVVAETESAYNYIQVVRQDVEYADQGSDPRLHLLLNEGYAFHSTYRLRYAETGDPVDLLTDGGPWDYFAVAPYVYPDYVPGDLESFAMLGAAAGTVPKQMLAIYGDDLHIDAVEIDPRILAIGQEYFDVEAGDPRYPNYTTHARDARAWLAGTDQTYDLIGVDAYHQPYIPFHLTTVEFFREVRAHLNPDGVVMLNAARPPGGDDRLVNALATTMRAVFPQVFIIDTRGTRGASNAMLVGVNRPVGDGVAHFRANSERIQEPALQIVMHWALHEGAGPLREFTPEQARFAPFTDDHAPVEQLIDTMVLDEARRFGQ